MLILSCDSGVENDTERLVVEAFIDTGRDLPSVSVRRTVGTGASQQEAYGALVADARVELSIAETTVEYVPAPNEPGRYDPVVASGMRPSAGSSFSLSVEWRERFATASGMTPSPLSIDSIYVFVPDEPVAAVLLDSLVLDSLEVNSTRGYVYPVEMTVWWTQPEDSELTDDYWVQAQLRPYSEFSSLVLDMFLLPEEVFKEVDADSPRPGVRFWRGIYAVLVDWADAPLPAHSVRVSILRSGLDYARYATSRDDPGRREPISNVRGGLGVVAGISIDSVRVNVTSVGDFVLEP